MGVAEYNIDDLRETAPDLKATHTQSIGDAYAATDLDDDSDRDIILLGGADDAFGEEAGLNHLLERFRNKSAQRERQ